MKKTANSRLGEVAEIIMGQSPDGQHYNLDRIGLPLITGSGQLGEKYPTPIQFSSDGAKRAKLGDIILSIRASIGDLNWADQEYYVGRGVVAIRTKPALHSPYLWWVLDNARNELEGRATGSTFKQIKRDDLENLEIPLPPLPEQRRIAAILDHADALRAKRRASLAKLDSLARSIFLEMFGDPATNTRHWEERPLYSVASKFSDGPFGSNLKSCHYTERGVRVVRLQNIGVGAFLDHDRAFISEGHFNSLKRHECLPGDILVGTLGEPNLRACLLPPTMQRALNKADCVQIRPDVSKADAHYLCALLNIPSIERKAQDLILGQTRLRISMGRLKGLEIPVPPLELQREFSQGVQAVTRNVLLWERSGRQLDSLFASLQHRAFQGEL